MKKPLVSVVIVTLNNREWLIKCLEALRAQNYKNIEVLVIDNGSIDGTPGQVKERLPEVKVIETGRNIGFGRAANKGIRKGRGKYILIYNDDVLCEKDSIGLLVDEMESDKSLGACQGTLLFADGTKRVESMGSYLTPTGILLKETGFKFKKGKTREKEIFNANLPLIRKKVLDKVGLFDEDYFLYFEEADLSWRIWLAGERIIYYPSAIFYHARGTTTKKLPSPLIIESAFGNRINSLSKNLETKNFLRILSVHLLICFGGSFAYFLKGKPAGSMAILRAIWRNIHGWEWTLKKRQKIQKTRKTSDKELFKKIMRPMNIKYFFDMAFDYLKSW